MRLLPWTMALTFGISAAAQAKPPLCAEENEGDTVRIDVIVQEKRVEPKECRVRPGTTVVWYLDKNKPFEADFGKGEPDPGKGPRIKSSKVYLHQEAKIKARDVEEETTYDYELLVDGEAYDPAIIIDPNK